MAFQKIEGASRRAVLEVLQRWRRISLEGAKYVLREGHKMLRAALAGTDPRCRWRRRFPPFLHIPADCPTLPPGDLRLLCNGDSRGA